MYSQNLIEDFFKIKKIIVFDENPETIINIKARLAKLANEYEISFTNDINEALKNKNFLFITDIDENRDFKRNIIRKVRENNKWCPIILLTDEKKYMVYNNLFLKNLFILTKDLQLYDQIEKIIKEYIEEKKHKLYDFLHRFLIDVASKFTDYFYVVTDNKGYIIEISDGYVNFLNIEKKEIINKKFTYFIRNKACIKRIMEELKTKKFVSYFECCFYNPLNCTTISSLINIYYIEEDNLYIGIIFNFNFKDNDFTKQNILSYKRIIENIANYLHDEISPLLAIIKMNVEKNCNNGETKDQIIQQINNLNKKIREISNELSYKIIDNYGLKIALIKIIEIKKQYLKNVKYEISLNNKRYNETIENAVYRICIELLNNTIKHANANNVEIKIYEKDYKLTLIYIDDGIGFDFENNIKENVKTDKQGLLNIINLIKLNKGYYRFSNLEKGYFLKIEIPIC